VQGGDGQEQDLLQFFLNVVEFGMTPQQSVEAATFHTLQLRESFENHESKPGNIILNELTPPWVRNELRGMGYTMQFRERTMGPVNAIMIDRNHRTFWGASSNHGEDHGIGW
jgi:gamma-glutamyltranspeptidase/glutathione hydrolase